MWRGRQFFVIVWCLIVNGFVLFYSGAEDHHAYVWDRFYGICLAKYQHEDVVNSVAFNPRDSEMLVTTSDDYKVKVRYFLPVDILIIS